jgi:hypothetical protein
MLRPDEMLQDVAQHNVVKQSVGSPKDLGILHIPFDDLGAVSSRLLRQDGISFDASYYTALLPEVSGHPPPGTAHIQNTDPSGDTLNDPHLGDVVVTEIVFPLIRAGARGGEIQLPPI